jgi:hypothetical protein
MTTATARTALKQRLDIDTADTQFDAIIDQFIQDALKRLWPSSAQEIASQTKIITVSTYGEATIDLATLTTPLDDVRKVEVSAGYQPYPAARYFSHGTILTIRELDTSVTSTILYGLKKHNIDLSTLQSEIELALIYFGQSEFYNYLAGNKRQYNAYMQNGRSETEGMDTMAHTLEQRARDYLEQHSTLFGHS